MIDEHPVIEMTGKVGLDASGSRDGVTALHAFAPHTTPVIHETRAELFDLLDTDEIDFAFIAVGDYHAGTVIDSYTTLSERGIAIIGEYVHEPSSTRFLLLAQRRGADDSLRFQPDLQAGPLWLDLPVLAPGRTSIVFAVPDEPGSLVRALGAISRRHLNLAKLEMRPQTRARCTIAAEIDGYAHEAPVKEALDELHRLASDVRVLGAYPAAG